MDEDDTFDDDRRIARAWEAPPSGFDEPDLIDQVVGMASLVSSFAAQRAVAIAEARAAALVESASRGGDRGIAERSFRLEISQALRVTESTAERLVSQAVALTERYDGVLDALGRGAITEQHARILVDAVDAAELPLRGELATLALELAERMPVGQFRAAVRALVERARAVSLEQRHDDAVRMRRVSVEADSNGMAWLSAYLPAVEARAIFQRLTAMGSALLTAEREAAAAGDLAETSVGDEIDGSLAPRTLDQVRADLLGDLLVDAEVNEHPEAVRGVRATVAVTVPVLSLLDDDAAAIARPSSTASGPSRSAPHAPSAEPRMDGCACSPTPRRASCSRWGARGIGRLLTCSAWCAGRRRDALLPVVGSPQTAARSTTPWRGSTAARRVPTTSPRCARDITPSSTTGDGRPDNIQTA